MNSKTEAIRKAIELYKKYPDDITEITLYPKNYRVYNRTNLWKMPLENCYVSNNRVIVNYFDGSSPIILELNRYDKIRITFRIAAFNNKKYYNEETIWQENIDENYFIRKIQEIDIRIKNCNNF